MAYSAPSSRGLRQADILQNVETFQLSEMDGETPKGRVLTYEYSLVLTQDCDLEQDYATRFPPDGEEGSEDKLLFGIILCGAYTREKIKGGTHRNGAVRLGSREWKLVASNREPRYQYLGYVPQAGAELVADFKDFFVVSGEYVYQCLEDGKATRLAEMADPYRQHALQRFATYLMRVGLPVNFQQLPGPPDDSGNS